MRVHVVQRLNVRTEGLFVFFECVECEVAIKRATIKRALLYLFKEVGVAGEEEGCHYSPTPLFAQFNS